MSVFLMISLLYSRLDFLAFWLITLQNIETVKLSYVNSGEKYGGSNYLGIKAKDWLGFLQEVGLRYLYFIFKDMSFELSEHWVDVLHNLLKICKQFSRRGLRVDFWPQSNEEGGYRMQ